MKKELTAETVAALAVESMLYEVTATPKPGLVDRANNGAHYDMDFFTFMSSAAALHSCFDELIQAGIQMAEHPVSELLPELRKIGVQAEKQMFQFTKGVNTHKGMIFSLGMLCGCWGWMYGRHENDQHGRYGRNEADGLTEKTGSTKKSQTLADRHTFIVSEMEQKREEQRLFSDHLCETAALMCQGICQRELTDILDRQSLAEIEPVSKQIDLTNDKKQTNAQVLTIQNHSKNHQTLTKGEQMYLKYGSTGVRGVVESGYEVVRTHALPIYRVVKKSSLSQNDALVHTLLYLIREMEDTNILSRHDRKTAEHAKAYAAKAIACGGMFSEEGRQCVQDMDQDFIEKYISPGGCADMLAVTHFLYSLEEAAV